MDVKTAVAFKTGDLLSIPRSKKINIAGNDFWNSRTGFDQKRRCLSVRCCQFHFCIKSFFNIFEPGLISHVKKHQLPECNIPLQFEMVDIRWRQFLDIKIRIDAIEPLIEPAQSKVGEIVKKLDQPCDELFASDFKFTAVVVAGGVVFVQNIPLALTNFRKLK